MSVLSGSYVVKYNHKVTPAGKRSPRALLCSLAAAKGNPVGMGRERRGRGGARGMMMKGAKDKGGRNIGPQEDTLG